MVVNHDGEGLRRSRRPRGGRFAAIGDLSRASAGEVIDCQGSASAAGRDRHPGAFSRARAHPQGRPGERLAVCGDGRGHGRVRNAEHRSADRGRGEPWRTRSSAAIIACIAISLFLSARPRTTRGIVAELERLPGCAGIKVFMGSSTGSLLVADDAGLRAVSEASFAAARRFTPRTSRG